MLPLYWIEAVATFAIPKHDREGFAILRDVSDDAFRQLLLIVQNEKSDYASVKGLSRSQVEQAMDAIRTASFFQTYADVPLETFINNLCESLRHDEDFFGPADESRFRDRALRITRLLAGEDKASWKQSRTAAGPEPTLAERFRAEAEKWDRETAFLSSTPKMVLHDSYQKIMAMGPAVVPLLLQDLQQNRRSWFWALRHLTQANPVPSEAQGNLDKMIAAWVAWGKQEGKI